MTMSAAEILGFGSLRGEVLRVPADAVLVLRLAEPVDARTRYLLEANMRRLAERCDVDLCRVVVLERGATLDALGDAELARLGLRRVEAD